MIILDTHVLIWWVNGSSEMSTTAQILIKSAKKNGELHVSSISVWEIAMLVKANRLVLSMPFSEWIGKIESLSYVKFISVDNRIAEESVNLPGDFHKDPADRIIVATARILNSTLVSADKKILAYSHVKTKW